MIAQLARRRRRALYRARTLLADARERGSRAPVGDDVKPELRILFVCLGNTCRSPLAEGVLRQGLADEGLLGRVVVDSAGVSGRTDGLKPDPRARRVARAHGLALGSQRARTFEPRDFDRFDRIVVFDRAIFDAVTNAARSDEERARISTIVPEGEIADPVAGDHAVYALTYERIAAACERLLAEIRAELA